MKQPATASASVVLAGAAAIIGGALGVLSVAAVLVAFHFAPAAGSGAIPPSFRPLLYFIWILLLAAGAFVIVVGIQLIRRRRWARIALLVIAGCMLLFGITGIGAIFFTVFLAPPDPVVSKPVMATVLAFIYGIPICVSLWWIILLTRRSMAAQFEAAAAPSPDASEASLPASSPSVFNNPKCPLAVRIVAWYLASFVLVLPLVPFIPIHVPAYYFGHLFRGPAATLILFFNLTVVSVSGVGLLLLRRWSFPLTIATQAILCANGLIAGLSPSFDSFLREVISRSLPPDVPFSVEHVSPIFRYMNLAGSLLPLAIIVTLFLSRHGFYAAALGEDANPPA